MIELQLSNLDKDTAKGLCVQFILHEYIKALNIAEHLSPADLEKFLTDTLISPVFPQPGILDRLCFYCEALVQATNMGTTLFDTIDELRLITLTFHTQFSRKKPIDLPIIYQKLKTFFPLLGPIFQTCLHSESALFSLLENREILNHHLGEKTVENLLQTLFPKGREQLRQALIDGFSRRGFHDFCQRHESLF